VLPDLLLLDGIPPFTQLVAFRPAITAVVAACAIGLLVWRPSRRFGAVVGVLSLIAVGMTLPRGLPPISSNNQLAAGRTLSVLSLNVQEGQADLGTVGAILAERHPDVVVLPEAGRNYLRSLAPVLAQLGYRSTSVQSTPADVDGVSVLWSSDTGAVIATPTRDLVLPDIELTGGVLGKIRIVGLHTQAPTPGKFAGWSADLDTLPRWCQADGAVILAGDFNATLDHHQLRSGMDGCEDAGSAAGDGLTATWPSSSPRWLGAQIDHVLTRGQIAVSTFDVIDVPRTDHRAIMATLVLPRDQSG
jgi:endonuclease/exonuclease/phosphatase family metal-dependent hydrolase